MSGVTGATLSAASGGCQPQYMRCSIARSGGAKLTRGKANDEARLAMAVRATSASAAASANLTLLDVQVTASPTSA